MTMQKLWLLYNYKEVTRHVVKLRHVYKWLSARGTEEHWVHRNTGYKETVSAGEQRNTGTEDQWVKSNR